MEIFDAHVQFGPGLADYFDEYPPLYALETGEQVLSVMDEANVRRAVVFAPRWQGGEFIDPEYETANGAIRQSVRNAKGRFVGLCRVNPNYGKRAHDALDRGLRTEGFRGLYLDPAGDGFNVNNAKTVPPLMEIAQAAGAPVLVDTSWAPAEAGIILRLAEAWPKTTIIMGHMGQRLIADALIVAARAQNVMLETSQCVDAFINQAVRRIGASRIVWGSGLPFHIPAAEIMKVDRLRKVSQDDKAAIFGGNLGAIFG